MNRPETKPLTPTFNKTRLSIPEAKPRRSKCRPAPISVRLNEVELAKLKEAAFGRSINGYIRERLFAKRSRTKSAKTDYALLARALGILGQSDLQTKLSAILLALECHNSDISVDTASEVRDACRAVKEMRDCLVVALGLKAK